MDDNQNMFISSRCNNASIYNVTNSSLAIENSNPSFASNKEDDSMTQAIIIFITILIAFVWLIKSIYLQLSKSFPPIDDENDSYLNGNDNDISLDRSIDNADVLMEFDSTHHNYYSNNDDMSSVVDLESQEEDNEVNIHDSIISNRRRDFYRQHGTRYLNSSKNNRKDILNHLKIISYSNLLKEERKFIEEWCSICLNAYNDNDMISKSYNDNCVHIFHKDCIVEWLLKHSDCPCCRHPYIINNKSSSSAVLAMDNNITTRNNTLRNEIQPLRQNTPNAMMQRSSSTGSRRSQDHEIIILQATDIPSFTWTMRSGITIEAVTTANQHQNTIVNIPPSSNVVVHFIPSDSNSNQRISFRNFPRSNPNLDNNVITIENDTNES